MRSGAAGWPSLRLGAPNPHYLLLIAVGLLEALTHFGTVTSADTTQYFNVSMYLLGRDELRYPERLVRPLVPLLAAPLSLAVGLPMSYGIVNSVFYVLSGILCYRLTVMLTESRDAGITASILLLTAFPMVSNSASATKEGGAIFFQFLAAILALRAAKSSRAGAALMGLASGIGALAMETVFTAVGFGLLYMLYHRRPLHASAYLAAALLPQVIPTLLGGFNLFQWYIAGAVGYAEGVGLLGPDAWLNPSVRGSQFIAGLSPLAALAVAVAFLRERDDERIIVFYLMSLVSLIAWLAWPPTSSRIIYIFYHSMLWLAGSGVLAIASSLGEKPLLRILSPGKWVMVMLLLSALLNNFLAYRWYLNPEFAIHSWGPIPGLSTPSPEMLSYEYTGG